MGELKGRTALVTGSTRGIGKSIALRLARDGAAVAIVGRRHDGSDVAAEIRALGCNSIGLKADVADARQVAGLFEKARKALGQVDILVNNAAVTDYGYTHAWDIGEREWDLLDGVNLKGTFLCCREAIPPMVEGGWGRIINISSTSGINGGTSGAHYAATKGGVIALSKALAREVAALGITVNVVAPSKIDTDMFRKAAPGPKREETIQKIPVGRLGQPEEIAEAVRYFAGENAGYTTGQVLVVSGGY
jgi:3-oxoacyl-[acyl-carrier protein] reductase